ncbi:MAG: DMT family transporter [Hyphomicrobiales bacterium]
MTAAGDTVQPRQSILKAAWWMLAWVAALSVMGVAGRELSAEVTTFQIMFFRSVISLSLVLIVWIAIGRPSLATKRLGMHTARNVLHFGAQYCWFLAIGLLPLAQVISIEFTVPVWTAIMAWLFLGERLTWLRVLAVMIGFAGVLVIVRPGFETVNLATAAVLAAAIGFGAVLTMTKTLSGTDRAFTIIFHMHLVQFLIGLGPILFVWVTPSAPLVPWAIAVGVAGFASHYCLSRAMAVADATVVVPLDFLRLPVMVVVGYLLYRESFDLFLFAGASMILAGNLMNVRQESRGR